eukprot:gene30223-35212_t
MRPSSVSSARIQPKPPTIGLITQAGLARSRTSPLLSRHLPIAQDGPRQQQMSESTPTPSGKIEPQTEQNGPNGKPPKKGKPTEKISGLSRALIAAAFICGLGAGVYYDSEVVLSDTNLSSTNLIDTQSPSSEVCLAYGYSASVFDTKVYVTYNPFNVYVTQPVIKGGCVLRNANMSLLEREKLVGKKDTETCKNRMNTFAFTGDLQSPKVEVDCVYHSESAENEYIQKQMDKGSL